MESPLDELGPERLASRPMRDTLAKCTQVIILGGGGGWKVRWNCIDRRERWLTREGTSVCLSFG